MKYRSAMLAARVVVVHSPSGFPTAGPNLHCRTAVRRGAVWSRYAPQQHHRLCRDPPLCGADQASRPLRQQPRRNPVARLPKGQRDRARGISRRLRHWSAFCYGAFLWCHPKGNQMTSSSQGGRLQAADVTFKPLGIAKSLIRPGYGPFRAKEVNVLVDLH